MNDYLLIYYNNHVICYIILHLLDTIFLLGWRVSNPITLFDGYQTDDQPNFDYLKSEQSPLNTDSRPVSALDQIVIS